MRDSALGGMHVGDLMTRNPVAVGPELSLAEFTDDAAWARRYTTYPVVDGGRTLGLLPFRSVAAVPSDEWETRRVGECMVPVPRDRVPFLTEGEELVNPLEAITDSEVERGLVLEDGRLVGLLSITDLARAVDAGGQRLRRRAAATSTHPDPNVDPSDRR